MKNIKPWRMDKIVEKSLTKKKIWAEKRESLLTLPLFLSDITVVVDLQAVLALYEYLVVLTGPHLPVSYNLLEAFYSTLRWLEYHLHRNPY